MKNNAEAKVALSTMLASLDGRPHTAAEWNVIGERAHELSLYAFRCARMRAYLEAEQALRRHQERAKLHVRIVDVATGNTETTCTLAEFIAANELDEVWCVDLERGLAAEGKTMFGGGAAPLFRIEKVTP